MKKFKFALLAFMTALISFGFTAPKQRSMI